MYLRVALTLSSVCSPSPSPDALNAPRLWTAPTPVMLMPVKMTENRRSERVIGEAVADPTKTNISSVSIIIICNVMEIIIIAILFRVCCRLHRQSPNEICKRKMFGKYCINIKWDTLNSLRAVLACYRIDENGRLRRPIRTM